MKKLIIQSTLCAALLLFFACEKKADYYYAKYLDEAENALPGKVDSLEIKPGSNRAILKFKIGPDRRIKKVKVTYSTSLSATIVTTNLDVGETDYGKYKEIELKDLPEATLLVNLVTYDAKGDSSNTSFATQAIYGKSYNSVLVNRVFEKVATVDVMQGGKTFKEKRIVFLAESGRPQDPSKFYPLQNTIVTYPVAAGGTKMVTLSLYDFYVVVPDIASSGTIKHYSNYKPTENAIDIFKSKEISEKF